MFQKKGITDEDLYNFFYVMSRYTGFGLRLSDAVSLYADKADKPEVIELMTNIKKDLQSGLQFSESIAKYPSVFPAFIIENLRVGEASSQMSQIFDNLVFHMEQEIKIKRDVDAALLPQKVFLGFLCVAMVIIIFFVIPKMGDLLRTTDLEMPLVTRLVISFGDFMSMFWWVFLILVVVGFFGFQYYKKNNPEGYDALMLKIPFFSDLNYNRLQYRFATIFGLCLQAGIDSRRALEYTASAVDNRILKKTLQNALRLMNQRGLSVQDALMRANETTKILHPDFQLMFSVAQSGGMDVIILTEAKKYQDLMIRLSRQIGDKIGLTVAVPGYLIMLFLFLAMEFPIFNLMGNISKLGGMD